MTDSISWISTSSLLDDVVTKHILSLTYSQSLFNGKWQTSYFVKSYINSLSIKQKDDFTITGSDRIDRDNTKATGEPVSGADILSVNFCSKRLV